MHTRSSFPRDTLRRCATTLHIDDTWNALSSALQRARVAIARSPVLCNFSSTFSPPPPRNRRTRLHLSSTLRSHAISNWTQVEHARPRSIKKFSPHWTGNYLRSLKLDEITLNIYNLNIYNMFYIKYYKFFFMFKTLSIKVRIFMRLRNRQIYLYAIRIPSGFHRQFGANSFELRDMHLNYSIDRLT